MRCEVLCVVVLLVLLVPLVLLVERDTVHLALQINHGIPIPIPASPEEVPVAFTEPHRLHAPAHPRCRHTA